MPLRNYTTIEHDAKLITPFFDQVKKETNVTFEAKFVDEMKYWAFPKGILYLFLHKTDK